MSPNHPLNQQISFQSWILFYNRLQYDIEILGQNLQTRTHGISGTRKMVHNDLAEDYVKRIEHIKHPNKINNFKAIIQLVPCKAAIRTFAAVKVGSRCNYAVIYEDDRSTSLLDWYAV